MMINNVSRTIRKYFFDPIQVSSPPKATETWPLGMDVLHWKDNNRDVWRLEDAVRGTIIFGNTGSGKTSGSARHIAKAFLKNGLGGLVLCVKQDEATLWTRLCKTTGRAHDIVRIAPDELNAFNFLDYERTAKGRSAGITDNLSNLLIEVMTLLERSGGAVSTSADPFWDRTMAQMLKNAIVLHAAAYGTITIAGILQVINSAPRGTFSTTTDDWKLAATGATAEFMKVLKLAEERCPSSARNEVDLAKNFFLNEFAKLADRTRSIVITSFSSMADSLLRPPLARLFCEQTTVTPENIFEGKILIVDLPVHAFRQAGKIANMIWKVSFKRACESRPSPTRPVFMWIDECQYLLDKADADFATTARSTKCCIVAITQNLPTLYTQMGGRASDAVEGMLGCLHTKIFHQNDDPKTNQYAANVVQKVLRQFHNESKQAGFFSSSENRTLGHSQQWDYDIPEIAYTKLYSGGIDTVFKVEAIVYESGRQFSNRKPWLKVVFDQKNDCIL